MALGLYLFYISWTAGLFNAWIQLPRTVQNQITSPARSCAFRRANEKVPAVFSRVNGKAALDGSNLHAGKVS